MNNKKLTSMQNAIIKNVLLLQKKKAARKKQGVFIVEGIRAVNEIPDFAKVEYYITTEEITAKEVSNVAKSKWYVVTPEIYKAISQTESPQGAMAVVRMCDRPLNEFEIKKDGVYLLLENMQDPGNLGTVIRSAHAFNIDGIFLTKGSVDLYSPKVVRSSMSSLFSVPIVCDEEASSYVEKLKSKKVTFYTTALEAGAKAVYDTPFKVPLAVVIGNEGNGLTEEMKKQTDYNMVIPMPGGCESLNASVATSICLYELLRQGITGQ